MEVKRRFKKIAIKLIPAKESCPKCGGKMEQVINGYICENRDWSVILKQGKIKWYDKVIMWINGYKTLGGAILWGAGAIAGLPWLVIIGKAITAGGGAHKSVKLIGKAKNKLGKESFDWKAILEMIINFLGKLLKRR